MEWRLAYVLGFFTVMVSVLCQDQPIRQILRRIPEELAVDTDIGDLKNDGGLTERYDEATVKMLQFDFLSPKGTYESYFTIDHTTGLFKIARKIDREEICPYLPKCEITVDIVVQPFQYFQIVKMVITILDMNDNSPTFPQTNHALTISESAQVGEKFPLPVADDKDSPRNGIQRYELQSDTTKFILRETRNEAGETRLHLILQEKLDREVESMYQLRVIAEDGGVSPKRGILIVTVAVGDQNDNSPRFDNTTYRISVSENAPVRSTVLQVNARDPDTGPNGQLVYQFSPKTLLSWGHVFGINNNTGQIYLKQALDYETKKKYHLSVTAQDRSENPYYGYTDVIINVQDVNDHAPMITVNTFTSSGTAKVSEWAKRQAFVAHISISDADSGMNGRFSCSVSDKLFELVHIYQNKYKLITTGTFDRETQEMYNVTLECRDKGTPQMYSARSILVTIIDKNDNYPTWQGKPYHAQILENNDISADIIRVVAKDADLNYNGQVKYKTDSESSKFVSIDENTGQITARAVFDYEAKQQFEIPVIAYDQGIPSKSSTTTVTLSVVNVNDETPVFANPKYMFGVQENQPVNTLVGELKASDADAPPYNKLSYALASQQNDAQSFYINPNTGAIKTRRMLDREYQDTYYLTAIVSNKNFQPPLSSTASVTIHVSDQNDNVPIVDFPNPANKSVRVSGDIPVGYEITKIRAHDDDLKGNKKLSFYIIEQSEPEMVTIDPWTGVITANKIPSFEESHKTVELKIQVKDNGVPQNSVETKLDIVMDKSIPFIPPPEPVLESIFSESNAFIWILSGVISISVLVILVLVIAIVCVRRRRHHNRLARYGYYGASKLEVKTGSLGHDRVWKFEAQDQPGYLGSPSKPRGAPIPQTTQPLASGQCDNSAVLYYQMQNQQNSLAQAGVGTHKEAHHHSDGTYQELGPPERVAERQVMPAHSPSHLRFDPHTGQYSLSAQSTIPQRGRQEDVHKSRRPLERQVSGCPSSIDSGRGNSVDAELHLYSYLDNHPDSEAGTLYENVTQNFGNKKRNIRTNPKMTLSPSSGPISPQTKTDMLQERFDTANRNYQGALQSPGIDDGYVQIVTKPVMNELKDKIGQNKMQRKPPPPQRESYSSSSSAPQRESYSSSSSAEDYRFNSDCEDECLGYVSDIGEVAASSPSIAHSADV